MLILYKNFFDRFYNSRKSLIWLMRANHSFWQLEKLSSSFFLLSCCYLMQKSHNNILFENNSASNNLFSHFLLLYSTRNVKNRLSCPFSISSAVVVCSILEVRILCDFIESYTATNYKFEIEFTF